MVIHLIHYVVLWINPFLAARGVSETLPPREIVIQQYVTYGKQYKYVFGFYVEAHDDLCMTNTMSPTTQESIVLAPTGNIQGSLFVFELNTDCV